MINEYKAFQSLEKPVPQVRRDLELIPLRHNGDEILYFHDTLGYVPSDFALKRQAEGLLSLLNGQLSIKKIEAILEESIGKQELLEFVQLLDRNCILHSDLYLQYAADQEAAFEQNPIRPSVLSGELFPKDPDELNSYLDQLFKETQTEPADEYKKSKQSNGRPAKALFAPHIDTRVGANVYANSFSRLQHLKPKRVVILATAHYTGYHPDLYQNTPFIGSVKKFEMPSKTITPDNQYMSTLTKHAERIGYTNNDRAHRIEHSIELHLLFANYIWQHDFNLVPILVNSFDELLYMKEGHLGKKVRQFTQLIKELDNPETFYLISGDLSHIGKKFGDQTPARQMRSAVEKYDQKFLKLAAQNEQKKLYNLIKTDYDPYRICGFPPLYTFMSIFPNLTGRIIDYKWWDEAERESAVSFGAVSY